MSETFPQPIPLPEPEMVISPVVSTPPASRHTEEEMAAFRPPPPSPPPPPPPLPPLILVAEPPPPQGYTPAPVPYSGPPGLTSRQVRLALLMEWGVDDATVEAMIATIENPFARDCALIEWRHSSVYQRSHLLVAQMAAVLGKTEEQIDAAWAIASTL